MPFDKDVHSLNSSMYSTLHDGPWCIVVDKGPVETDYHQATADNTPRCNKGEVFWDRQLPTQLQA